MLEHILTNKTAFFHKYKWVLAALLQMLFLLNLPSFSLAGAVEVQVLKGEAIIGETLSFAIKFEVDSDEVPIDVSQVQYNGTPIPYEINSQSTSSFTMIVNGKTVRSSTDLVKNYIFTLPAEQVGILEVPAFTVAVGGKNYKTKALTFTVTEKPTSDDLQFLVQIKNPQSYYYPSQVIDLECTLLFRNFKGNPAIENISLPILKNLSFELLPDENPNFEMIINGQRQLVKQQQRTQMYQGKRYNSLTFHLKFRIMNHGEFHFENSLKMVVETGRTYRQPSLFFGFDVSRETKPVFADSEPLQITVHELPQENVPPSFNGAIGNFKIKVTPSSDTAIRVGDPITLLIDISGRGTWEFVKSPPIDREQKITDYFIVSSEPVVGEVNEDKTVKSFSVRLRVKSKTVTEIPAIPFTYFNLASRKYVTVYSDPIPIQVFEAAAPAKITDFSAQIPEPEEQETSHQTKQDKRHSARSQAEQDNKIIPQLPPLIQISDNVPSTETKKNHAPVYGQLAFAFLPLLTVFLLYLFSLYKGRDISSDKSAHLKSKTAYKQFKTELDTLAQDDATNSAFCSKLGQSIHKFIEDRYQCSLPFVNGDTLPRIAREKNIRENITEELLNLVEKVDQYRYSPKALSPEDAKYLLKEAKEVIKKCN